jgi:hypothetical protein
MNPIVRTAALVVVIASGVGAQQPRAARPAVVAAAPDSLIVSLLTLGPGAPLFDRFGHTAVRIRRPLSGLDSAWNWGMYDFNAPNFIGRWLTGDTQYWMAGYPTAQFVNYYRANGRVVIEQELTIDLAGADSLLRFLRWNAREENKFYRYDYYLDNCSTRARDALDMALGGAILRSLGGDRKDAAITFRSETLRHSQAFPTIAFGMTFALGRRADAGLSPWEQSFIPTRLRDQLRTVRVGDAPLVRAERTLVPEGQIADESAVPSYAAPALIVGVVLHLAILLLGRAARSSAAARALVAIGGSVWHLLAGIAGTMVLFAGLFTRHEFMGANASVLLGTPVSLALVWFYARGWSTKASPRVRGAALALATIAGTAAVVALLVHLIPSLSPSDWAPALLIAPVHLALCLALLGFDRKFPGTAKPA